MSEVMQLLFEYAFTKRANDFFSLEQDHLCASHMNALESALLATLTAQQKDLWRQWYDAHMDYQYLCEQALFQAAFSLAKELN